MPIYAATETIAGSDGRTPNSGDAGAHSSPTPPPDLADTDEADWWKCEP
jgi:hypothetical protein